jgi:hypothetical protein
LIEAVLRFCLDFAAVSCEVPAQSWRSSRPVVLRIFPSLLERARSRDSCHERSVPAFFSRDPLTVKLKSKTMSARRRIRSVNQQHGAGIVRMPGGSAAGATQDTDQGRYGMVRDIDVASLCSRAFFPRQLLVSTKTLVGPRVCFAARYGPR